MFNRLCQVPEHRRCNNKSSVEGSRTPLSASEEGAIQLTGFLGTSQVVYAHCHWTSARSRALVSPTVAKSPITHVTRPRQRCLAMVFAHARLSFVGVADQLRNGRSRSADHRRGHARFRADGTGWGGGGKGGHTACSSPWPRRGFRRARQ